MTTRQPGKWGWGRCRRASRPKGHGVQYWGERSSRGEHSKTQSGKSEDPPSLFFYIDGGHITTSNMEKSGKTVLTEACGIRWLFCKWRHCGWF